jgi:hypothetical protein
MNGLKKDMKLGFFNVIRSWKSFIPFFIAAIIVQSLFISILTIGWSVEVHYKNSVSDDFKYHYVLEGMDDNTHVVFHNHLKTLDPVEGQIAKEIVHETYPLNSGTAHRYYVTLNYSNYMAEHHFKDVKLHSLRHTFASLLLAQGMDLCTVRDLMGHKDIETTEMYLHSFEMRKKDLMSGVNEYVQTIKED